MTPLSTLPSTDQYTGDRRRGGGSTASTPTPVGFPTGTTTWGPLVLVPDLVSPCQPQPQPPQQQLLQQQQQQQLRNWRHQRDLPQLLLFNSQDLVAPRTDTVIPMDTSSPFIHIQLFGIFYILVALFPLSVKYLKLWLSLGCRLDHKLLFGPPCIVTALYFW